MGSGFLRMNERGKERMSWCFVQSFPLGIIGRFGVLVGEEKESWDDHD